MNDDDQIPPWTLGWRLQRALSWADMNTEEMAYELGVARSTISRWCNDKGHPTRGYLKLWAQRTRVPLNWLLQGDSMLPRGDSNSQPAGMEKDHQLITRAEIISMRKHLPIGVPSIVQSAHSR
jgi:transcriptional regulator with XRE-family HTH domain